MVLRKLFRGAQVIDPSQNLDSQMDILVEDGYVGWIGKGKPFHEGDVQEVDLHGLTLFPGLIDVHVHFREPGQEHKETIYTGGLAAVSGGFSQVIAMANTSPTVDSVDVLSSVMKKGKASPVRFNSVGAVTLGLKGRELAPMEAMAASGAVAFSDDGLTVADPSVMMKAFEKAASLGLPISVHCEDPLLWGDRTINRGAISERLSLQGVDATAEEAIIQRDILFAAKTGANVHVQHVSTALGVDIIRKAKADGIKVSAEVTPHHLLLTDDDVLTKGTNGKMSPPLRTKKDTLALQEALTDGTIDVIATDHAPHSDDEKAKSMMEAPNGIVGLETCLSLILSELVGKGKLGLSRMVQAMSCTPAALFGLPGGSLRPGSVADMTAVDMESSWVVDPAHFLSKAKNTPFAGMSLKGRGVMTVISGEIVFTSKK
ncbi:dihydroorotase [Dethiosulfovibrio salsuginis]|uniref:dihydroorotase n=1 Tax=Dethiosulfovibrio salsuginis TaxID=561720 RepID=UPI000A1CCB44|nr:dihydroorotase [Dethiosulfovibrio salsuginis]